MEMKSYTDAKLSYVEAKCSLSFSALCRKISNFYFIFHVFEDLLIVLQEVSTLLS